MNSLLLSLSSTCRLRPVIPILRSISTRVRPVPAPRGTHLLPTASPVPLTPTAASITTPDAFLKSIGRSCDTKVSVDGWDDFWQQDRTKLKSAGVGVRDRRYILWCMEKYRSGLSPEEFAYDPKPKKTIRAWGPTVQEGQRIRSRRDRNKPSKKASKRSLRFKARRLLKKPSKKQKKTTVTV
ncbi:hypothetical protein B0H12DRAFT_1022045 [Mycena haematopus]|nr:hypothetical protein B0H12DRAFT_1022045 [Mycena haematopus]